MTTLVSPNSPNSFSPRRMVGGGGSCGGCVGSGIGARGCGGRTGCGKGRGRRKEGDEEKEVVRVLLVLQVWPR